MSDRSAAGGLPPDLPVPVPVRAGGVELAVRRLGTGRRARRLIALHGGPGLDHHPLLPLGLLLAERYEVWLPDLPGHGGSITPAGRPPGVGAMERALGAWFRGLRGRPSEPGRDDRVVDDLLLGHSLGAWFLERLLRRRRIRPAAAVLLSPPAAGRGRDETALRRAVSAMGDVEPGTRSERARRELHAHVAAETRGAARSAFLQAVERTRVRDPRLYRALLRNFHRAVTGPVRPFDPQLPVQVLCGEEDRTTPPGQARRVAESLAGARFELLPDAGHYPFAERPEETARRILAFLRSAAPPAAP